MNDAWCARHRAICTWDCHSRTELTSNRPILRRNSRNRSATCSVAGREWLRPRTMPQTSRGSAGITPTRGAPRDSGTTASRWPIPGKAIFPIENLNQDGFERTSPVTAFPPNGYGVYDMIGNVREWTSDWWSDKHQADAPKACCVPLNPRGGLEVESLDPCQPSIRIPRKSIEGGSHLCAPNYCRRYRPAARHAEPIDTSTSHVGFRCVVRSAVPPETS